MTNKGFSISLNGYPVKTKNFRWYMSTYYSVNLNKVQTDDARNYNLNDYLNGTAVVSGQPISTFYSYKFLGLNPQNGAPMFDDWEDRWHLLQGKTLDEVVPMILVNSGTRDPKFSGDLNNTFTYKNWSLSLNFSYSLGSKVRLFEMYGPIINGISAAANVREEFLDRWQVPGMKNIRFILRLSVLLLRITNITGCIIQRLNGLSVPIAEYLHLLIMCGKCMTIPI